MIEIAEDECYHLCNRGMHKREIFRNDNDCLRFLFLITHFQSAITFPHIEYDLANFKKVTVGHRVSNSYQEKAREIVVGRVVGLCAFALMPNHFHLIVKETKEKGIPIYMQRILNAYTKYFNTKYKESGHLFQGPYRIVHIGTNDQLLHTSAYIHRNCRELSGWKGREIKYPWSSFQDFSRENRFGDLLSSELILEQFEDRKEYEEFVDSSSAKDFEDVETFGL